MAKHDNEWVMIAVLAGGAYIAWRMGFFGAIASASPSGGSILTPATPSVTAGGVKPGTPDSHAQPGGPDLELFNASQYGNYWTTITGNHPDLQGQTIGSIKTNGGNWVLYGQANYAGPSVPLSGLDFPDASAILAALGGQIGSAKYVG